MVLTPEGAVAARTLHRFMCRVTGASWDFKASVGEDVHDGSILERTEAQPPDPAIELPASGQREKDVYSHASC